MGIDFRASSFLPTQILFAFSNVAWMSTISFHEETATSLIEVRYRWRGVGGGGCTILGCFAFDENVWLEIHENFQ